MSHPGGPHPPPPGAGAGLALAALGIVFGDIGTSPLYAFKECVNPPHGVTPTPENVLGILSLLFWSLTMVVTVKYLVFILRADNRGEGGILALLALLPERAARAGSVGIGLAAGLALAGAALLFGDGIITPAISVLSAVEGLEYLTHSLRPLVVPLTVAILLVLFAIQHRGTGRVGALFGPIMLVWFVVIGGLGFAQVVRSPEVLGALWPGHAVRFFRDNGGHGFRMLGSVVLAVTGGEALYADLGHFGRDPIRRAWLRLVFPALLLAYFGQGALVLKDPAIADHVFFALAPAGIASVLLVLLATAATVIASQALISGAFSLTHQAVQLGYFPRVTIAHTSRETEGQIYVPEINWALAVGCVSLVLVFRQSARLAAAYGIAVSGTMAITSLLYYLVVRERWGWSRGPALALLALFLAFDLPFLAANLLKIHDGGWVPLVVGLGVFLIMLDWKVGRTHLFRRLSEDATSWALLVGLLERNRVVRTPGVAVYLASSLQHVPPYLVHHIRRTRALPERAIAVSIQVIHDPQVPPAERITVTDLGAGVHHLIGRYGFTESPRVPALLAQARAEGLLEPFDAEHISYYIGRETILAGRGGEMGRLSETLFAFLTRNARNATAWFGLPPEQVVEIGAQIDL